MTNPEDARAAAAPAVLVHPPVLVGAALLVGLALDWALPLGAALGLTGTSVRLAGGLLLALGVAGLAWAVATFRKARTNVPTYRPALVLVESGPYALSRNPIYVAGSLGFLGLALLLANPWLAGLGLLLPVVLHYGVVRPEEVHLAGRFGAAYADYCRRVPRWLLV